jgi:hypothetical protein
MNKIKELFLLLGSVFLISCNPGKSLLKTKPAVLSGMEGMVRTCMESDTVHNILISKVKAILTYEDERYEVNVTLYSERDSIIYLSAVNSGFEILRASVKEDSIKVIDRMNKIVYRAPLYRRFGYQYPVNFRDLQNLIAVYYLCDDLEAARDDRTGHLIFEFDEDYIKKRILLGKADLKLSLFEFYQQQTDRYLMGERMEDAFKIYSNFIIGDIEIIARGGERSLNRQVDVKMEVNPRRYTFTELR